MKTKAKTLFTIDTIALQHELMGLPKPQHPLVSIARFEESSGPTTRETGAFMNKFYAIAIKRKCTCQTKYGQNNFDYNQGMMSFFAPDQLLSWNADDEMPSTGWSISIHPDFLRGHVLEKQIKIYGFFHYAVNEALHLSPKEEKMIERLLENIHEEYHANIDNFSQEIILSHLSLLLNYANRFYNRQFITRRHVSHDLLIKLEEILDDYFNGGQIEEQGLPTVKFISDQLHLSPNYLSDLLRNLTGQNTQQHIHNKLIEKAKSMLTSSSMTVGEIAYYLGFEYAQSFNKLFKSKTRVTPLEFRASFN
ncbi:helix-turn-helix domain-containing protein [Emticicia agri]|uniref:AraC family transcriptional regulator n=1 Tax=Emticicia agri TaxID=2492393 RepID=A0A4Q5LVS3_9BACT|nr:AraC family transcriptional regulator [Emticicia agri]RYU93841.1 AraC family transcriptional regulator [Emticicia agri]